MAARDNPQGAWEAIPNGTIRGQRGFARVPQEADTRAPGRRSDEDILADKDAVIMNQSKRELRRRRKPKS